MMCGSSKIIVGCVSGIGGDTDSRCEDIIVAIYYNNNNNS